MVSPTESPFDAFPFTPGQLSSLPPHPPPRGSGKASGVLPSHSVPSATLSRPSLPQSGLFPVSSPRPSALQQLHRLSRSSSGFHDQLNNVLYGDEYVQCVRNLQGDDFVWLVEYLDKVRRRITPLPSAQASAVLGSRYSRSLQRGRTEVST